MALCVSQRSATARLTRPSRGPVYTRRPVVVRAGLGDALGSIAQSFVHIFSPPKVDATVPWEQGSGYSGPDKRSRTGPFKDGYSSGQRQGRVASPAAEPNAAFTPSVEQVTNSQVAAPVDAQGEEGALAYVGKALERVVGHNFRGDASEPEWPKSGVDGWKGDIHGRGKDGFHSTKH